MRLAHYSIGQSHSIGLVIGQGILDLRTRLPSKPGSILDLMEDWAASAAPIKAMEAMPADIDLNQVVLHAPISRPGKIMGIGLNYADHAAEAQMALPADQLWFSKPATAIADPYGPVQLPKVSTQLDYEAELVMVIGKKCRHVARDQAKEVIFGYCAGNDLSVRDWQFKTSQFILGKSFDSHAPIGPWIVTADTLDPHALDIRSFVNKEERQHSNTKHFIFDCYAMVETLSKVMTLEPGDLIFTGTPAGVGAARKPPIWLRDGDVVRVEIEGIGAIENRVTPE